MAHNATNRRTLATAEYKPKTCISMDPTLKKEPKPTPFISKSSCVPSNHTIDHISNKFSNLYANHKILKSGASTDDDIIRVTSSADFDHSCTALTKSKSHNGSLERKSHDFVHKTKVCSSEIELANFFSCNGVKVVAVDMPQLMQIHVVNCARKTRDSLENFTSKALALTLKKEFDGVYGPAWHCIVGTSFGSFVTHSVGGFIYFSMDHKHYVLLFKTTVLKAES